MRVIKENNIEKVHKCSFCKSLLAYKMTDIYEDCWYKNLIRCPVCKHEQQVSIFDRKVKK